MGNHDVGRAMAAAAAAFFESTKKPTKAQALKFLDVAAKPWRGSDAEFDDALYDDTPLRRLIELAFDATAEEIRDRDHGDKDGEAWYSVINRFSARYEFC